MDYYVKRNDKINGPFSRSQIENGIQEGKVFNSDSVGTSKAGPWTPIHAFSTVLDSTEGRSFSDDELAAEWIAPAETSDSHEHKMEVQANNSDRMINPPVPKTKACPFCAEPILLAAVKCKHCGELLEKRTTAALMREKTEQLKSPRQKNADKNAVFSKWCAFIGLLILPWLLGAMAIGSGFGSLVMGTTKKGQAIFGIVVGIIDVIWGIWWTDLIMRAM